MLFEPKSALVHRSFQSRASGTMSEIGKLADEVRKTFPQGSSAKSSAKDAPSIENGLGIEIISAKGLALPLEHREQLQSLEVSTLYEKQHVRSNSIACTSSEPEINMKVEYPIMKSDLIQNESLIMIYISIAPTRPLDQSKCGISSCSRTLISSAAIDPRLACIYGNEYMNVELMPCENDGVSTSSKGAGSIYVKLVLIVDGQYSIHQGDIGEWETKYGGMYHSLRPHTPFSSSNNPYNTIVLTSFFFASRFN